jgi:hypothetical protein
VGGHTGILGGIGIIFGDIVRRRVEKDLSLPLIHPFSKHLNLGIIFNCIFCSVLGYELRSGLCTC